MRRALGRKTVLRVGDHVCSFWEMASALVVPVTMVT